MPEQVAPDEPGHRGATVVDSGRHAPIGATVRPLMGTESGHTGGVQRSSTTATTRVGVALLGVVLGVVLLAWGIAGCTTDDSAGVSASRALDGPVNTSSAASLDIADLRAAFNGDPVPLRFEVIDEISTDPDSFTQGLEFTPDGRLFESTGRYGRSALRRIDPASGATIDETPVDPTWWAEGITLVEGDRVAGDRVAGDRPDELAMLTWREGVVAFFDPDTLTERRRASYDGEGWGLCQLDDGILMMSNGTADLTLRDPGTFAIIDQVTVTRSGNPLPGLNELECAGGLVWANVWPTDTIVAIDPSTGEVLAELDASGIFDRRASPGADVLNGIAMVPGTTDQMWLAGKLWPSSWVVRVQPA